MSPSSEPALSVIITCFNEGPMLLEAVASAESNTRGGYEIILVNGGSKDPATLEVLAGLAERGLRILHDEDRGPSAARNVGIRQARGRYILPLDADNRIRPAYIDRGIDLLDADPTLDVVYGDPEFFGAMTGRQRRGDFNLGHLLITNYIDTCAVFRKSAWERVGGFDEHIPAFGFDDWDFWMRLSTTGSRFLHVDEVLFDYRMRPDSLTMRQRRDNPDTPWMKHLRAKQLSITWERLAEVATWEFAVFSFRRNPFRTIVRLVLRAYLPGLRRWWIWRVHKVESGPPRNASPKG